MQLGNIKRSVFPSSVKSQQPSAKKSDQWDFLPEADLPLAGNRDDQVFVIDKL